MFTYLSEGEDLPNVDIPLKLAEFELENGAVYHICDLPSSTIRFSGFTIPGKGSIESGP